MEVFQRLELQTTANKWFLPLVWAARLVGRATEDGMIVPPAASAVMGQVATLAQKCLSKLFRLVKSGSSCSSC